MMITQREKVVEHDGILWKPKPGTTSSFADFLAARVTFIEIHRDARWNPWVEEVRASELEEAMNVMEQWTRGEPGFRYMTEEELDAQLAEVDKESKARHAADEARWERDRARYDPEREAARLSLLEQNSILDRDRRELAAYLSGELFPAMVADKRQANVTELKAQIVKREARVEELAEQVGDPEDVVDKRGHLPRDRREISLLYYDIDRKHDVRDLRQRLPEIKANLRTLTDRGEKSKLRYEIQAAERKLADLMAVPPLTADDMCSECATPANKHGLSTPPYDGPCPAWPGWAARIQEVRRMFFEMLERNKQSEPAPPPPPKSQPLATVPSGLPIGEVAKRLAELEEQYPGAVVKRGPANRWEIWPAE